MPFRSDLIVKAVNGSALWDLVRPLFFVTANGRPVTVPAGYRTDLASVPRPVWWLVPRDDELARRPAVVHDYIYTNLTRKFTKAEADLVFYDALLEEGMPKPLAWLMYTAVRIGGRGNWSA
ncbi:hypothetical protein J2Y86_005352 [Pseudomonas migulae]|uniref:DUF1353 domain-containing protein n=1 Tax=Pseudomonas migulae TaxID=78543 RepID=UPI0020A04148|nr:DUF1353 domain-containing protein [Pseudomonas migulae]MCP1500645.1 hypothetical protein [Pseudomonas migulae]